MSYQKTWAGDWHGRILERVNQLGFETVTSYASARPRIPLFVLAQELGSDDVAGAQIRSILIDEAVQENTITHLLRDLLVRELCDALPNGWKSPLDEETWVEVAMAVVRWSTDLKAHLDQASSFQAGKDMKQAELPAGWIPDGPDDPIIVAFVDRCLGRAPS